MTNKILETTESKPKRAKRGRKKISTTDYLEKALETTSVKRTKVLIERAIKAEERYG